MSTSNARSEPWTVRGLLAWTQEYFARHGLESPRLCAELLLAHAMSCPRIHLYTQFDAVPDASTLDRFRNVVSEASTGRPIAYLTGTKEFFSLSFEVTPDVLIPRPETEILVERTIDLVRRSDDPVRSILDLGTGSGCIAVSLAKHLPDLAICASDISQAALDVARRNAEHHEVADRITFVLGDLFDPWPLRDSNSDDEASPGPLFDVIVCNPPYVAAAADTPLAENVRKFEPHVALIAGPDGLDVIRRIVDEAPSRLTPGGHLLMEIAFDQSASLRTLLDDARWCEVATYCDAAGHERVVRARSRAADQVQVA